MGNQNLFLLLITLIKYQVLLVFILVIGFKVYLYRQRKKVCYEYSNKTNSENKNLHSNSSLLTIHGRRQTIKLSYTSNKNSSIDCVLTFIHLQCKFYSLPLNQSKFLTEMADIWIWEMVSSAIYGVLANKR